MLNEGIRERELNILSQQSLKRKREDDCDYFPRKNDKDIYTYSKDPGTNTFRSSILQNGDAKAFWYFPNLRYEVDKKKNSKIESEWFYSGNGSKWRLLLFPFQYSGSIGLFVEQFREDDDFKSKKSVNIYLEGYLTIGNKLERKINLNLNCTFSFSHRDWGYENFIVNSEHLNYLSKPSVIEVTLTPMRPHEESKSITGYNGLINEGTTCYMNSLLQTLYFLTYFRKAVYNMPTSNLDSDRLPMALQLIFYHLQVSNSPASTKDLLKSFGWTAEQWNVQHDVQEFNCVLSDHLEKKMKGTPSEGTYSKLFLGKMISYIECVDVDYKSTKIENFIDLQLNVKGCENIYQSFDKYIEVENMTEDNMYEAEGFGKQNARKGVIFEEFPPVLQLQLKRFEYESTTDRMVKLHQCYEFYETIDLSKYTNNKAENWKYSLFSILVHKGNAMAGHYYSYISPKLDGKWYLFNDDSVDKALKNQALEGNFGGEVIELEVDDKGFLKSIFNKNEASAYMLVYIHEEKQSLILEDISSSDLPARLQQIYEEEAKVQEAEFLSKIAKDMNFIVHLVSLEVIKGWNKPGISPGENDFYSDQQFSTCKDANFQIKMKKNDKGKDLFEKISGYTKDYIKLWVYTPGFYNWRFQELNLEENLMKQTKNQAVYVESTQHIVEKIDEEWVIKGPDSPNSQGTEIIDEVYEQYTKIIVFFKWYEWDNCNPSLRIIGSKTFAIINDTNDIKKEISHILTGGNPEFAEKISLSYEKSWVDSKDNEKCIETIDSNLKIYLNSSEVLNMNGNSHICLQNGDVFIGEIIPENPTQYYVSAKSYILSMLGTVVIDCELFDKYQKFGYRSFSSQMFLDLNHHHTFKITTQKDYSEKQIRHQLAEKFSITQKIEHGQIQLYMTEGYSLEPKPISDKELNNFSVSRLISLNKPLLFDILPYPVSDIDSNLLIYLLYVDEKFEKIQQYHKLLNKDSKVKDLDQSLKLEMMEIFSRSTFASVDYFLINFPQKSINKILKPDENLEFYCKNPNFLICFRTLSLDEQHEFNSKVKNI